VLRQKLKAKLPTQLGRLSALFHAGRELSSLMRINFATTQDAQFWEVLGRLRAEQG